MVTESPRRYESLSEPQQKVRFHLANCELLGVLEDSASKTSTSSALSVAISGNSINSLFLISLIGSFSRLNSSAMAARGYVIGFVFQTVDLDTMGHDVAILLQATGRRLAFCESAALESRFAGKKKPPASDAGGHRQNPHYFFGSSRGGCASRSTSWNSKCDCPWEICFSPLELNLGSLSGTSRGCLVV